MRNRLIEESLKQIREIIEERETNLSRLQIRQVNNLIQDCYEKIIEETDR